MGNFWNCVSNHDIQVLIKKKKTHDVQVKMNGVTLISAKNQTIYMSLNNFPKLINDWWQY